MTIRVKQQRKQCEAIKRLARSPFSPWRMILSRGYVAWVVFESILRDVRDAEESILLNGTDRPFPEARAYESIARTLGLPAEGA